MSIEQIIHDRVRETAKYGAINMIAIYILSTTILLLFSAAIGAGVLFHWLHVTHNLWQADLLGVVTTVALSRGFFPIGWAKKLMGAHRSYMHKYEEQLWRAARCYPDYYNH